ncbi:MAG: hypothetical protein JWM95_1828 [Gemmatimonadetes bacterium]|nr:hypothetical protein [Gemmatimonadota bacterium]
MRCSLSALAIALPALLAAQNPERISLEGREVAIYNLAGRLTVSGGTGDRVVVEVTRAGRDASKLKIETGDVRGRMTFRVRYPEDRIYYSDSRWNGHTNFSVNDDGTFGDNDRGRSDDRRRIEVSSRDGLDAHADLHVSVPNGKTLFLRNGVGETSIENVDGQLNVDVATSHVRIAHVRGSLTVDGGSGGIDVTDMTGNLKVESGSGGAVLDGIRGGSLNIDVGSGSLRGRMIDVTDLTAGVGSGGVRLSSVRSPKLQLESGSGGADVELLTVPDDINVETGSGGITLRMPAATSAEVDIRTGSGGIDSDFEVKVAHVERRALRGTIGSGRGRIRIESGSGTVRLLKN